MERRSNLAFVVAVCVIAVLLGGLAAESNTLVVVAAAAIVGILIALWLATRPRAAFALYLLILCAVPVWAQVDVGIAMPPTVFGFLLVLPAVLRAKQPLRAADWWLLGYAGVSAVGVMWFDSPKAALAALIAGAGAAYIVGRRLAPAAGEDWTYRAFAVAAGLVAAWACVELAFDWHMFEHFVGRSDESGWAVVQVRGGVARSEAAFGHSIAMGGFLVLGIPFALGSSFRNRTKLLLLVLLAAGLLASLSRGPILGGVLAALLVFLFLPSSQVSRGTRWTLFVASLLATFFLLPKVLGFFTSIGPEETAVSVTYRYRLLDFWTDDVAFLGRADSIRVVRGETLYRGFQSIDNAWLVQGLQFGWVALGMVALAVAVCAWRVLGRRGGPAEVSLVASAFVLGTVALITQYGAAVWLVAGMAVAFAQRRQPTPPDQAQPRPAPALAAGRGRRPAASGVAPARSLHPAPDTPRGTPLRG